MDRLRQRADFLAAAASGIKAPATAFVLQVRKRSDDGPARVVHERPLVEEQIDALTRRQLALLVLSGPPLFAATG